MKKLKPIFKEFLRLALCVFIVKGILLYVLHHEENEAKQIYIEAKKCYFSNQDYMGAICFLDSLKSTYPKQWKYYADFYETLLMAEKNGLIVCLLQN